MTTNGEKATDSLPAGRGRVVAIWIKRAKNGPMDPVERTSAVVDRGLRGNADQGGKRQVTVIERERWAEAEAELGRTVDPRARRANIMVEGIDLRDRRQAILHLGPCRLRLLGETRPCARMDRAAEGLQAALSPDWRAGAYGEVIEGGEIEVGCAAWIEE